MTVIRNNKECYYAFGKLSSQMIVELRLTGFRWNTLIAHKWATYDPMVASKMSAYMLPTLKEEVDKMVESWKRSHKLSYSTEAPPVHRLVAPEGLTFLPHQVSGIKYMLTRKGTLCADEMGLGKTIEAIGALNWLMDAKMVTSALIVCPSSLKINWKNELKKWMISSVGIQIATAKDEVKILPMTQIVIINYDILKKWVPVLVAQEWGMIIADESHYLKNPQAKRTKAFLTLRGKRKIALSGTPMPNCPKELWTIAHWMRPDIFYNQWYFFNEYCNVSRDFGRLNISGGKNLKRLQTKLRCSLMIRRKKEDVLKDLPEKRRQIIELPHTLDTMVSREQEQYDKMQLARRTSKTMRTSCAKKLLDKADYKHKLEEMTDDYRCAFAELAKIRKELAMKKLPICLEHVDNVLDNVDQLVVFCYHKDPVYAMARAMEKKGITFGIITGDTPAEDRQAMVDEFQAGNIRTMIGTIGAMGTGLTLTAASNVLFLELDWTSAAMEQAEDRCHRIGQHDGVLVQYLVLYGSLDNKLINKIVIKGELIKETLDIDG
jgi:SWI/SNF-related matrix-associated actin-dependent regulator 1 of chromatin subfamily A